MATCKAELHLGDDYGDNRATVRCQLEEHDPKTRHREEGRQDGDFVLLGAHSLTIEWEGDDRDKCTFGDEPEKTPIFEVGATVWTRGRGIKGRLQERLKALVFGESDQWVVHLGTHTAQYYETELTLSEKEET